MVTIEELAAKVAGLEQQMAAITVPPTEYYTSIFSGEDIDAAIKKVNDGIVGGVSSFNGRTGAVKPQAGDYNATQIPVSGEPKAETVAAALSNKAPAGFGLGTSNPRHIDDANNALESGWYYLDASTLNGPESAEYSNVMLVLTRNSNPQTVQVSFNVTDLAFELRRVCTNGVWSPWEWVNPPMQLGVEYRTVERYNGKPIYIKAVSLGLLENNTSKSVEHGISDFESCVECSGFSGPINLVGSGGVDSIYATTSRVGIDTNGSFSSAATSSKLNTVAIIKYTKTTD